MSVLPVTNFWLRQRANDLECSLRWDYARLKEASPFSPGFSSGFGGSFVNPKEYNLPNNPKVYLFRQFNNAVVQSDIDCFFNDAAPDDNIEEIWVFKPNIKGELIRIFRDRHRITRGVRVYYAIVILDVDSGEISEMVTKSIMIT